MPDTYQARTRTVSGKALKKLRREGILPASIYGRGIESISVELPYTTARDLMNAHGFNSLVNLTVEGEAQARPVVVKKIDRDPISRALWHIDFLQVDLNRTITGPVMVHLVGEAPVVKNEGGVIVAVSDSVEVEALPADMPEALELSLESLESIDQSLYASDLMLPAGVTLVTDPEHLLVAVTRARAEVSEAAAETEGEEGAEGEAGEGESTAPEAEASEEAPAAE